MADTLPDLGSDWGPRLSEAGFSAVTRQDFEIAVDQPLPPEAGRYAQLTLLRTRSRLEGVISADDLAILDAVAGSEGPMSVLHREDLAIRGIRTLWTGTRS